MGASSKKESALERRQHELERESQRIRDQVKTLEKMAQRLIAEGATPGASPRRAASEAAPSVRSATPKSADLDDEAGPIREAEDNVVWTEEEAAPETAARPARHAPDSSSRLADYLATGSFGKASRSISYERRIMRNKAIVMMVVALLAAFILYGLLR